MEATQTIRFFLVFLVAQSVLPHANGHVFEAMSREQLTREVLRLNRTLNDVLQGLSSLRGSVAQPVTTCPSGWLRFQSSCYGVGSESLSWPEAQEMCRSFGASLAEVDNEAENNFIKDISRTRGYRGTWLGATDIFSDGHWVWVTSGRPLSDGFTDWFPGQPGNDGRSQDCLTNWREHPPYRWGDLQCEYAMPFVCEIKTRD